MSDSSPSKDVGDFEPDVQTIAPKQQSVLSLLISAHLMCVAVGAISILPTSDLGVRLLSVLGPHMQFLSLDLDYSPYYLTRETLNETTIEQFEERTYLIEYVPEGQDESSPDSWQSLQTFSKLSPASARYYRFTGTVSYFDQRDEVVSVFVRDIATHLVTKREIRPSKIRIRQHKPVPRSEYYENPLQAPDPFDPSRYVTRYVAQVVINEDLSVNIIKDVAQNEAAATRDGLPKTPPSSPPEEPNTSKGEPNPDLESSEGFLGPTLPR